VNIEHLLDHPRVMFIEGSITDLDLLAETRWAEGLKQEHPRYEQNLSTEGVNVRNLRNPGVLRAER
jgi:hypothetical protein